MAAPVEQTASSPVLTLAKRGVSGLLFIPFFFWLVRFAPAWAFEAFVVLVGALAHWEFTRMFARTGVESFPRLGLLAGVLVTGSFARSEAMPLVLTLTVAGMLGAGLWEGWFQELRWTGSALTLLGVFYVNWLIGHAIWLRVLPHGMEWIFLLVWVTWVGESAAYFVGSLAGRHKLAPVVSPAKTLEGATAQLLMSPAAALAGRWWFFPECALADAVSVGMLLGVVGQVGDLVESFLKRSCRTKDTGALIPGHGGLLDRLDSLLFNTPALYYYARFIAS
jgi:phosphatidate cytidylyltransferase